MAETEHNLCRWQCLLPVCNSMACGLPPCHQDERALDYVYSEPDVTLQSALHPVLARQTAMLGRLTLTEAASSRHRKRRRCSMVLIPLCNTPC